MPSQQLFHVRIRTRFCIAVICATAITLPSAARGEPQTEPERVAYWIERLSDDIGAIRAFAAARLGQIANADIDQSRLTTALQSDPDPQVRASAAKALGRIGGETLRQSIGILAAALQDSDADVRSNAAATLAQIDPRLPTTYVGKLVSALSDDAASTFCATALAKIGKPAVEPLVAALADPTRKAAAASALSGMSDAVPQRFEITLAEQLDDEDPQVSMGVAKSLGKMGARAVETLVQVLASGSQDTRIAAIEALAQIDGRQLVPHLPQLAAALDDESALVRIPCAAILGEMGVAGEALLSDALLEGSETMRSGAAMALSQIDPRVSDESIPAVIDGLSDERRSVQRLCRTTLEKVGPAASVGLIEALERRTTRSGLEILNSLIEINRDPTTLIPVLRDALDNPDVNVRLRALSALRDAQSKSKEISGAIAGVLKNDPDSAVRLAAQRTLTSIGPAALAADAMFDAMANDPDSRVRLGAVREIADLASDIPGRDENLIQTLTRDSDAEVRLAVIDSIVENGIPNLQSALPAIISSLDDDDRDVRKRAMDVIDTIPSVEESAAILSQAMTNQNRDVRRRAGKALLKKSAVATGAIPQLVGTLARALTNDPDYVVRSLAARTLGNLGPAASAAADALLAASHDPIPGVSTNAIRALRNIEGAKPAR